jgi:2-polyprenyl-6-hydroxyphenyl methylase/3-demethylubiquinone-9 3-methyltransferase
MSDTQPAVRCKCCNGQIEFFGTVDFAKTCEDRKGSVFRASGVAISYFQCRRCGFVFTDFCDAWSAARMADEIYNEEYVRADPEFIEIRPHHFSTFLTNLLGAQRHSISILDYGGGRGTLAALLGAAGFVDCATFDPFFGQTPGPARQHDLVTAFEVVEHSRDPLKTFQDALSCMASSGALLFTTTLQPDLVDVRWWYIAPRNGHVSIHTRLSLAKLALSCRAKHFSFDPNLHMFYRDRRSPIARTIVRRLANGALFHASRTGIRAYLLTARRTILMGTVTPAINPRHLLRALIYSIKPLRGAES